MEDLISVVIPVYNVEKYLSKCLESIINQTYKNIEIICVNDGSEDNCSKILSEYKKRDNRIKIINKENGGLSSARNAGIDISTGKYITFIDSDDYIDEDCIEFLYKEIIENNADLSVCSHKVLYENGGVIDKATHNKYIYNSEQALKKMLYDQDYDISAWAKLYNKKLFKNVRYPNGRIFEDSATTYKLMDNARIIAVNSESKYNYIIRKNSITTNDFSLKRLDLIKSTEEMCDYINSKYKDLRAGTKRRLVYAYLSTLTQLLKSNHKNPEIEKDLCDFIKRNSKIVLKDKETPKRDRLALVALKFGPNTYKFVWKIYEILTGRK